MSNFIKINILFIVLYIFAGCGANGSLEVIKKGVFLDSAYVSGIRYQCGDITGTTDKNGIFLFNANVKKCEFYLGKNKFIVSPSMLQDRIITPFEITTSLTSAFQLSRIIQSIGVKKDNVLIIDTQKADKLGLVDLTNPVQVAANISSISPYVKKLEDVKKDLSKHYNLETGLILTPAQKEALNNITITPTPVTPTPPISTCQGASCPTTPPKQPITNCPIGAVCVVDNKPFDDSAICLPGASCPKPKDTPPCFPGSSCDDSNSSLSCLPGQSGASCNSNTNVSAEQCLPGQSCQNNQKVTSCLPGTPCGQQSIGSGTTTQSPPTTNAPTYPNDNSVCLPGASCIPQTSSNPSTQTTTITSNPSTPSSQSQCTPLPGRIC